MMTGALLFCFGLAGPLSAADETLPLVGADEAIGTSYRIELEDLPAPYAAASASNRPVTVPRPDGAWLRVAPGFEASLFAEGLSGPRALAVAADGAVFVSEPNAGRISKLVDLDGDGVADKTGVFAKGFHLPSGLALKNDQIYIADERAVWSLGRSVGPGIAEKRQPITRAGAFGDTGGHWTRMLTFAPDGQSFFVSIGSEGNLDEEPLPRATIQRFDLMQGTQTLYASGLRNPVGMAYHPHNNHLYTVVNERDGYGDGMVPDFLVDVRPGGFYGWPYAYLGPNADPRFGSIRPDLVAQSLKPDVLFAAHSAPVDIVFNAGSGFPDEYLGDAFVSLHGSWNADTPTGYKIVRVPFAGGRPVGHYETFAAGFWTEGQAPARVWGRPTGLAFDLDGSLLIADDVGGTIWRVRWAG